MENEEKKILSESKSAEATNAVGIAEQARQQAHEAATSKIVEDTLAKFFASQTDKERFISTQRIPFICTDIREIKETLVTMAKADSDFKGTLVEKFDGRYATRESFALVQRIVFGAVTMILVAVFGAIIALVVMNN